MEYLQAFYHAQPAFWFMVFFIVIVGYLTHIDRRFVKKAVVIEAEVVAYETIKDESSTLYEAKLRYAYGGQTYYGSSGSRSAVKRYEIGQKLSLLVNPDNPREIRVSGSVLESPLRLFRVFMIIFLGVTTLIFIAWYVSSLLA